MNSPDSTSLYPNEPAPPFPGRIPESLRNVLSWKQAGFYICRLLATVSSLGVCRYTLVGLGLGFLGAAAFTLALPFLACLPYLTR